MSDPTSPSSEATKEQPMTDQTAPILDEPAPAGGATPGPTTSFEPFETASEPVQVRRGPSVPTIVWGLLFALIAAVVMIGQTSEVDLNLEVSVPVTLLVAGVVLVVWGVAGLGRSRRRS
jgi:hypothetical protein